jgi:hypothetical protein
MHKLGTHPVFCRYLCQKLEVFKKSFLNPYLLKEINIIIQARGMMLPVHFQPLKEGENMAY